jgi:hypothetical protein
MKQGTGWADAKENEAWIQTARHINNAAARIARCIPLLNGLTRSISFELKLSAAQLKMQSDMNRYLAPGAGSDPKAIQQLTVIAVRMLNALHSDRPVNFVVKLYNTAEGWPGFLQIGPLFFSSKYSGSYRDQIIGHEIFHSTHTGNRDTIIQPA